MTKIVPEKPIILAIDTSCDDTSAAVTQGTAVLSNVIASQTELHKPYGGVFPTVAKQAHKENIEPTVKIALKRAGVNLDKIEAIAATQGPGLAPSLEVGLNFAKNLARKTNKPFIAVNHIEGHALSPLAQPKPRKTAQESEKINFPVLAIVISGGHSQFILIKKIGDYEILGSNIDDAAGECLDKVGRMLNLGYPAGPVIEQLAKKGNPLKYDFPLPMTTVKNYNLSFSGLKTYARNLLEKTEAEGNMNKTQIYNFSASFQRAVFRHITYKLNKILESTEGGEIKEVWLGGGVAANVELRKMIRNVVRDSGLEIENSAQKIKFRTPYTKKLCADNGAMIGVVAGFKLEGGEIAENLKKIERKPRWKIGEL